ncbi:MAG: Crp/Fnr family transcriptional regulator [Gammaproteobacteria bacterium]|nr:Crp/Fnr family transcriptional regulator [Gammaproteobacteria bacterium]
MIGPERNNATTTGIGLEEIFGPLRPQDDPAVARLMTSAQTVRLDAGSYVFHAGDPCAAFLVLLDGNVRVQITSAGGREVTLYRIGSGGSCILTTSCLLSSEHYPADAITETDVVAAVIPMSGFQRALDESGAFRQFVFDGFATRLTHVIRKIEQIVFASIDARLAATLLAIDARGEDRVTHQDLATELGTAREVISRHLKRFEQEGSVELGRGRLVVLDRDRLRAIADNSLCD